MANLYQIQDDDRPMWVVADSFEEALEDWRGLIKRENPCDLPAADPNHDAHCRGTHKEPQPQGVSFICEGNELLIDGTVQPSEFRELIATADGAGFKEKR
jgi:hypothetical protein